MRRFLLILLLTPTAGLLSGCAVTEEDKDFYYRGWLRPTDLDREPPPRLGPRNRPEPPPNYKRDPLIDY